MSRAFTGALKAAVPREAESIGILLVLGLWIVDAWPPVDASRSVENAKTPRLRSPKRRGWAIDPLCSLADCLRNEERHCPVLICGRPLIPRQDFEHVDVKLCLGL
jgi:hypothetical protein